MGANAQTSVPTFTAGDVLTAANMNISARTGVPVFADTTARDAAFGGAGEKTLAEGQLCYVENLTGIAQLQYYDGSTWQSFTSGGLQYITGATFTSVSSVSLPNNTFTATYRNYKLIIDFTGSSANVTITGRFRASGTDNSGANYYGIGLVYDTTGASFSYVSSAATSLTMMRNASSGDNGLRCFASLDFITPQIAITSRIGGVVGLPSAAFTQDTHGTLVAQHNTATQFDAFSFIASTGTFSGVYRVYGYSES